MLDDVLLTMTILLVLRQKLKAVAQEIGRAAVILQELSEITMPEQGIDLSGEMAAPFRLEPRVVLEYRDACSYA